MAVMLLVLVWFFNSQINISLINNHVSMSHRKDEVDYNSGWRI